MRLLKGFTALVLLVWVVQPAVGSERHGDDRSIRQTAELEHLPEVFNSILRSEFGASIQDKRAALTGAINFFLPYPGGNGRACATCHNPQDGYSLSPKTVELRWRKLQAARLVDPTADDPLFRSIDADDGNPDYTLLRTRAH
jgi:hypothetical protein